MKDVPIKLSFIMSRKYLSFLTIILSIIQLSLGVFLIPSNKVSAYGNGFLYSRSITIDHTKVPNTDQTDFPVLVSGTYSYLATTANGGNVQNASGYDIGFYTNSDCSTGKMNWETEKYTAATGEVVYWVKNSSLTTATDTVFYMCYGNSSISTDQSSATSVWDSNFKGVWHLNETAVDETTTADLHQDSTTNNNDGDQTGNTNATGKIATAQSFDGTNDYVSATPSVTTYPITMSIWAKNSTSNSSAFSLSNSTAFQMFMINLSSTEARIYTSSLGSGSDTSVAGSVDGTQWTHVVGVLTNSTNRALYINGTYIGTDTNNKSPSGINAIRIGSIGPYWISQGYTGFYNGSIDDVRISNIARSADWIATEYNNQSSPSTFYAVGAESTDTTAPVFSSVTPATSSSIDSVTSSSDISFTTDEALASGSITITQTSGTADGNSPHVCTLNGTALDSGAHTISLSDTTNGCTSDVSNLVSGAVYTFVFEGSDANANAATPITRTSVTFDNTAPVISEVTPVTTPTSDDTPEYTFTTDEAGTISYGGDCSSATTSATVGSNTVTFSTLADGAHSNCTITVTDATGNVSNSLAVTAFTVDTTAPAVSITAPADLATVSGATVSVTADATDAVGIVGVQFKLDGVNLSAEDTISTYGISWDSTSASEGSHTLSAVARDEAGNSTTATTITVTVNNIVIPTLTTAAASSVSDTSTTLNGSIDTLGGENATDRGFEWGLTNAYGTTTTEPGSHSAGSFTSSLSSLTCATPYHFRAYAVNSAGTGYGSDQTFTTSLCPVSSSSGGRRRVAPVAPPPTYIAPIETPPAPDPGFIASVIPDFLKKKSPPPEIPVKEEAPQSLSGDWKPISDSLVYNFVLAPLPTDITELTSKFPELDTVFAELGIRKISDLDKLQDTDINLPIITDEDDLPSEILVAEGGRGLITLGSSLMLTSRGEMQQKIGVVAGKPVILSVKPESPTESVKGYLLFKSRAQKSVMEVPTNSLVANILLARSPVAQTSSGSPTVQQELLIHSFEYTDPDHDGIFSAEITAPVVEGEYEVLTVINYKDAKKGSKELRMITVVDPEGYVYEKNDRDKEVRLDDVKVSIWNISNDTPSLWEAEKYSQDNPQITDNTGKYSFLVPPGKYYITAEATGYISYKSEEFEVKEGTGIHFNIEMERDDPWFRALLDWKMIVIVIFGMAIVVNFVEDRRRERKAETIID